MKYGPVFSGGEGGGSHAPHFHFKLAPAKKSKDNGNKCSLKEKSCCLLFSLSAAEATRRFRKWLFVLFYLDFQTC